MAPKVEETHMAPKGKPRETKPADVRFRYTGNMVAARLMKARAAAQKLPRIAAKLDDKQRAQLVQKLQAAVDREVSLIMAALKGTDADTGEQDVFS